MLAATHLDVFRPRKCDKVRTDRSSAACQSLLQFDELRPRKCDRGRTDGLGIGPKLVLAATHLNAFRPRKCIGGRTGRSSACHSLLQFDELRPRKCDSGRMDGLEAGYTLMLEATDLEVWFR